MTVQTVERVPLARLKPAPWNPRTIKDSRFRELCRSIEADPDFLERRPILATDDGTIYAGNMRYRAVEHLGWESVPAILETLPDKLAKERALRDNNAWGEWQEQELAELVYELKLQDSDLDLLGFDPDELKNILELSGASGEPTEDPGAQIDRAEDLREKWGTERGQLWVIGRHRLLCGDSTSADDVARLMGGERADCVFTDPPYGVNYEGGRNPESNTPRERLDGDDAPDLYQRCLQVTADRCKPNAPMYVWFAGVHGESVYRAVTGYGYSVRALIVWNKLDAHYGNFMAQYMNKHEPCLYCVRESPPWHGPTNETTVWDVKQPTVNENHPTEKPVDLAIRALTNSSDSGALVTDWFLGSGTTMVAAEQLGRVCYGMEIEPKYVAVALQRLADMGLEPQLQA